MGLQNSLEQNYNEKIYKKKNIFGMGLQISLGLHPSPLGPC